MHRHTRWSCRAMLLLSTLVALALPRETKALRSCATLSPAQAGGAAWHVYPGGTSTSCVSTSRFGSLQAAAACTRAGDTIAVHAGTYTGRQTIANKSGASSSWIRVTPAGDGLVVFDAANAGVGQGQAFLVLDNVSYVAFDGGASRQFEIKNSTGGNCVNVFSSDHVVFANSKIHDCFNYALLLDSFPASDVLHDVAARGNDIYSADLYNANAANEWRHQWPAALSTGSGGNHYCVHFENNVVHENWGECMDAQGVDTGNITGNTVYDCFSVAIYLDGSTDMAVDRNYVYARNDTYNRRYDGNFRANGVLVDVEYTGLGVPNTGTRITNNIFDSVGRSVELGAGANYSNLTVAHNTIRWTDPTSVDNELRIAGLYVISPGWGTNFFDNNIVQASSAARAMTFQSGAGAWVINNNFLSVKPSWLNSTNLQGDPMLVGPALGSVSGYRLQSSSPALDAGTGQVNAAAPRDFFGVVRDTVHPSMGIDEGGTSQPPPPPPPPNGYGVSATLWTRQFGTSADDQATAITASGGYAFAVGSTRGGLEYTNQGSVDAWVRKYDSAGTKIWGRQLGAPGDEIAYGVAVDGAGNVYVGGTTTSPLYTTYYGGLRDGFLAKYAPDGSRQWIVQIGTSGDDGVYGVSVDGSGYVYVAGFTGGGLEYTNQGGIDAFVQKYNASGTKIWGRQLGAAGEEIARSVSADASGNVYVGGSTTVALYTTYFGGPHDGFMAKYTPAGTRQFIRQVGTTTDDVVYGVSADASGVFLTGTTMGSLDEPYRGGLDAFVRRYDGSNTLMWSHQIATAGDDIGYAVSADGAGNVVVVGSTTSTLDPTSIAYQGGRDAFVTKWSSSGARSWVKQLGTAVDDEFRGVAAAGTSVYAAGSTGGVLVSPSAGAIDAVLSRYAP